MTAAIHLRPARLDDYGFALALYLETIRPYAAELMTWRDAAEAERFEGFWRSEQTRIVLEGAEAIGWVQVEELPDKVFLRQFYLTPARQRRGIGSQILSLLIREWAGRPAQLSVLRNNPARRLYERFGFSVRGESGIKLLMRREAQGIEPDEPDGPPADGRALP